MDTQELRVTAAELLTRLRAYYGPEHEEWLRGQLIPQLNRWLARGDGVAVYENHDLGHPDAGELRLASYGSPAAQLEGSEPPARLPDIGGMTGWRYALVATYQGEQLNAGEDGKNEDDEHFLARKLAAQMNETDVSAVAEPYQDGEQP
jgi:hypothetical protein